MSKRRRPPKHIRDAAKKTQADVMNKNSVKKPKQKIIKIVVSHVT